MAATEKRFFKFDEAFSSDFFVEQSSASFCLDTAKYVDNLGVLVKRNCDARNFEAVVGHIWELNMGEIEHLVGRVA